MRRCLLLFAALRLAAQRGDDLLARVDHLRHPWPDFTVDMTVEAGTVTQRWKVLARENGDARIEGLSEAERGRVVLMLGDDMWLLFPGAKRPLKVTPQQRLLGPAAGGDVARTRFAQDYAVADLREGALDGQPCWRLDLTARKLSTSAHTVVLWVAKEPFHPMKAEFFLASGKLARTALFDPPVQALGQSVLSRMTLVEGSGAKAEIRFSGWARGGVGREAFQRP
jgi:hypothetical protein